MEVDEALFYMEIMKDMLIALKGLEDLQNLMPKRKKRSCSVRKINLDRNKSGYFNAIFKKIKQFDKEQFFFHTRMDVDNYNLLLLLTKEDLIKTSIRTPISPDCRLALTLTYLSQGVPVQNLACSFKMGKETARKIILETCEVIWALLSPLYVSEPNINDFESISKEFYEKFNIPNCIGAIDGNHIAIQSPKNSGSQYFNNKKHNSIVLMGACDTKYCFTYVDVGTYGSRNDGGIFQVSSFGQRILERQLPIPPPKALPGTNNVIPHFFVADAAFPLHPNIMKPFPAICLPIEKQTYNTRIYKSQRVIENTFGILVTRWRILLTTLNIMPENAEKVILACIALHNFLRLNNSNSYCPTNFVDWIDIEGIERPGEWRNLLEGVVISSIRPSGAVHLFGGQQTIDFRQSLRTFFNES